jgi:hypothetical protein
LFLSASLGHGGTTIASAAVENTPLIEATSTSMVTIATIPESQDMPIQPIVSVEQYVKSYFAKNPIMAEVARCESRYRQFGSNGNVLRGIQVSQDVGVMQINETYHLKAAQKLGYNIYTLDGNLAYGQYLYEKQGTQPWSASAPCWNR